MVQDPRIPFGDLDRMMRQMEQLLNRVTGSKMQLSTYSPGCWTPQIDVTETGGEIVVLAEIPGLDESSLELVVDNRVLSIRGERVNPRREQDRLYHQLEIPFGRFERAVELPAPVDADRAEATYDRGLLMIALPKAPQAYPSKVYVKSSGSAP